MKFGKVENIEGIDFSLPSPFYQIKNPHPEQPMRLYMGATAWVQKAWKGGIYPAKTKPTEYLHYYSDFFGTIELNSTFYTIPKKERIIGWKEESAKDFRFCPKVYRGISHSKDFGASMGHIDRYLDSIVFFEEKLGACFLQLPAYFDTSRIDALLTFLSKWPNEIPLSIEVRNQSLIDDWQEDWTADFSFVHLLHLDVSGRRDLLHGSVLDKVQVIRWVGNGLHSTDYSRAQEWIDTFKEWQTQGVKEVYLLLHQPDNILTPDISSYFRKRLEKVPDIALYPEARSIPLQAKLF